MIYQNEALGTLLKSGWGELYDDFYWSVDRFASILLPIDDLKSERLEIQLLLEPYIVSGQLESQSITIYANGLMAYSDSLSQLRVIYLDLMSTVCSNGILKLDFSIPDAVSPFALGLSDDQRVIGIKILEFAVIE
jgi:hypothetical protein